MTWIRENIKLLLILAVAAGIRLYGLDSISLWHDEAFSALLIKYSWPEMFYRIGLDVHPPAYYVFLRIWHYIFGDSLFALRGMSAFFGVGTVLAGYLLVRDTLKNRFPALLAAALIAINPFQAQYVTEARMYTMGACFALLAAWFLIRALESEERYLANGEGRKSMLWAYAGFVISMAVIIYTHYYLLFIASAIALYGAIYHLRMKSSLRGYGHYLGSLALVGLTYVPWLPTFLFQYRQVGAGYWIPPMDIWSIPSTFWTMLTGITIDLSKILSKIYVTFAFFFSAYIIFRFLRRTESFHKWLIALALAAPFGGAMLFFLLAKLQGSSSSVYLVRYFLFASAFYTIILGVWLSEIRRRLGFWLLILALLLLNGWGIFHYWNDMKPAERPGMSAASEYLRAEVSPSDKLFVGSSFMFFNFKYYNPTSIRPLLFTGGNRSVHNLPHFAGTAILTDEDLLPEFSEGVRTGDTVWLIWTNGFGSSKPGVPAGWQEEGERSFAEIRPYVGTYVYITKYRVP
jgi:mannosyltransferase